MRSSHAAWLKKHRKSKLSRGEASKKESQTGTRIQRGYAKDEGTTMQLRPRDTYNSELANTLDKEANFYPCQSEMFPIHPSYNKHQLSSPNRPTGLEFDDTGE